MTRLPNNYELPRSEWGKYTKLQDGTTKIRILTSPIIWREYFTNDNKPNRSRIPYSWIPVDSKDWRKAKEFRAFVVYNYDEERVQVMNITQKSLKEQLLALARDTDFGDPKDYDIKITKSGKGLETTYTVMALWRAEFTNSKALEEAQAVNLEALFEGNDPFMPL